MTASLHYQKKTRQYELLFLKTKKTFIYNQYLSSMKPNFIFAILLFAACFFGVNSNMLAQTNSPVPCVAADTNSVVLTLNTTNPFLSIINIDPPRSWRGYYSVYLSQTPTLLPANAIANIVTNSTSFTINDLGGNNLQYNTPYYIIVYLISSDNKLNVAELPIRSQQFSLPTIIPRFTQRLLQPSTILEINNGILNNVVVTRVSNGSSVCPPTFTPLTVNTLKNQGVMLTNAPVVINITWKDASGARPPDATHPATMTWAQLNNFLYSRISTQTIDIIADTPIAKGSICQPCISSGSSWTAASLSATVTERTKTTIQAGLQMPVNVLYNINVNNCIAVCAELIY
ncbi:MAG: hypothetical protein RI894_2362 [Bacteroidota bacterium]|jgi:hypothetical protein